VCKTASFFATYPEMESPEWLTWALEGLDLGMEDDVSPGVVKYKGEILGR